LTGREDEFAQRLRQRCWKEADLTQRIASLGFCTGADAWQRREKLFDKAPHLALTSLRGVLTPRSDELLRYYATRTPKQVLAALTGRSDDLAYELRAETAHVGREVVDSVRGLNDEQAWQLREQYAERYPSTVIHSLLGLPPSARSTALRQRCELLGRGDLHTARRACELDEYDDLPDWTKGRAALDNDD
jgi:dTMP kinase